MSDVVEKMKAVALIEGGGDETSRWKWPEPDQLTVNEYEEGVGIGAHIDTHSGK